MGADRRALYVVPAVASVVALPALVAGDLPIGDRILFVDRASQVAASAALGLWVARRGSWSGVAVVAALAWCTAWIFEPRAGLAWRSFSLPDAALVVAVTWALSAPLLWMPQWAWAATLLTIAAAKIATLFVNSEPVRLAGLAAGIVVWSHMASVTASQASYALGPWIYFPLALINALTLTFVAWDIGRHRAGG